MQLIPYPALNPTCDTTGITIYPLVHQRFKGHPHIHMVAHQRSTAPRIIEKMATLGFPPQRHPFSDSLALVICPITHLKEHETTTSARTPIISYHMGKEQVDLGCICQHTNQDHAAIPSQCKGPAATPSQYLSPTSLSGVVRLLSTSPTREA